MAEQTLRLEGIVEPIRSALEEYCDLVRLLGGANARSLTLFGAIVSGGFDATRHVVRNVVVLERVE